MESDRFDRFARAIGRQATRRNALTLLSALGLGGAVAVTDADAKKKRKKKKKCKAPRVKCGKKCCPAGQSCCNGACIPETECCTDADCGPLYLCAQGVCVIGQGVCPAGSGSCGGSFAACGTAADSCACFVTTTGQVRCGSNTFAASSCSECVNDQDCRELYPQIPGIHCVRGGANCGCGQPTDAFCMDPCPS